MRSTPEHIILREHDTGIDDEDIILIFDNGHILANLASSFLGVISLMRLSYYRKFYEDLPLASKTLTKSHKARAKLWLRVE